jgi:hypothetical protein
MTTGVPTGEFDQYGGYDAVKAMFDANGGSYGLDSIPAPQRQQLAQQIAITGSGNMSLLISEQVSLLPSGLAEMAKNGIDSAPIFERIQSAQVSSAQASRPPGTELLLTPSVAKSLMHRSMTTGVPSAEMVTYGGYDAVKAMYDGNSGSYGYQDFSALEKQTFGMQVAATGVGNFALPTSQGVRVGAAVLQAMRDNGIDHETISKIEVASEKLKVASLPLPPASYPFVDSSSYIDTFMGAQKQDPTA